MTQAYVLLLYWFPLSPYVVFICMAQSPLPEQFIKGLTMANLQGRAQIVPDRYTNSETSGDLVFYLDGAHSPESMEICARWFSLAIKEENQQETFDFQPPNSSGSSSGLPQRHHDGKIRKNSAQVEKVVSCFKSIYALIGKSTLIDFYTPKPQENS